jgi:hypothetical protein
MRLSRIAYENGVTVTKEAMRVVEVHFVCNPQLPKWDILILPACPV